MKYSLSFCMNTDNSSFEMVKGFKYLRKTLTNPKYIREEIESGLKSGNVCYHSVQKLLSFSVISKNLKIKIHRNLILPVFFVRV